MEGSIFANLIPPCPWCCNFFRNHWICVIFGVHMKRNLIYNHTKNRENRCKRSCHNLRRYENQPITGVYTLHRHVDTCNISRSRFKGKP